MGKPNKHRMILNDGFLAYLDKVLDERDVAKKRSRSDVTTRNYVSAVFLIEREYGEAVFASVLRSPGADAARDIVFNLAEEGGVKEGYILEPEVYTSGYMRHFDILQDYIREEYGSIDAYLARHP